MLDSRLLNRLSVTINIVTNGVDIFDSSCAVLTQVYVRVLQNRENDERNHIVQLLFSSRDINTILPTLPVTTLDPLTNLVRM